MNEHFEPDSRPSSKTGLLLLQGLIWLLFIIFALRFWYLQLHKGEEFAVKARNNQLRHESLYAPRGLIRDRNGELVAVNEPSYSLGIIREDVRDLDATLAKVSDWTGIFRDKLDQRFDKGRTRVKSFEPLIVASDLPDSLLAHIESNALFWPGMEVVVRPRRQYPQGELLAHVLGYVAEANEAELEKNKELSLGDDIGKGGLELVLERRLRGNKGLRQIEVDATGRRLDSTTVRAPSAGENVTLSIDLGLQRHCAEQMKDKAGAIVVMEPDTGKILAFVSTPSYDNNLFVGGLSKQEWAGLRDHPRHPLQNRAIQSAFPPASVFKILMAGCALSHNISPSGTAWCPGFWRFGNRNFRCWRKGGHGWVDMKKALVHSCDVFFYQVGDKLGVDKISEFAKQCGFGVKTGIDLPHEKSGLIPTREWKRRRFNDKWHGGENLNLAIGQGYTLATPLQVARFIGSIINGGKVMKPLLLDDEEPTVQDTIPIKEEHAALIREAMVETVEKGTARRLKRSDAVIGGKTGTAQVVRIVGEKRRKTEEMPYHERDHAWLASFGTKDGKTYVAVCMVEHGGHGSSAAGPVLKEVYNYLFGDKS